MCYFSSKQAFLVSADWDVVSYILHASQGESKHYIPKCKTNLSTWRRLNLELEPCRAVQMIRIDCKQICHTRPSSSSTGWPIHVIGTIRKKNDAVHNVYFVQYDAPVSKMPLDITCIVYLCIWYRGILRGNHGFRVWKLQKYERMYFPHTGTNKCSMGYHNSIFKNGLNLFSCAEKYTVKSAHCDGQWS